MNLPIHTPPIAGESWVSYLNRVCRRLGCHVGYLPHHSRGITYPDDVAAAADAFGLDVETVQGMHLQSLEGLALPEGAVHHSPPRRWQWIARPPHCPLCDHQKLIWHLPWITTCTTHALHLTQGEVIAANTAAVARSRYFEDLAAGERKYAAGWVKPPLEVFDTWRDALILRTRMRRRNLRTSPLPIPELLEEAAPFVLASSPEQAATVLKGWWRQASPGHPQASLLHGTHTLQARHAIDAITAHWKD